MENEKDLISAIQTNGSKEAENFYLKFHLEFGPAFSEKEMTNGDLVTQLEEEVTKYKNGLLSELLNHVLGEIKRLKTADSIKSAEKSSKTFTGEFFRCGSCGRGKKIYCYIDPYTNIRDCTCDVC